MHPFHRDAIAWAAVAVVWAVAATQRPMFAMATRSRRPRPRAEAFYRACCAVAAVVCLLAAVLLSLPLGG